MDYAEKRRFSRAETNHYIPYYILDKNDEKLIAGLGRIQNISDVGLLIVTDEKIKSNYILVVVTDERKNIIEIKGKVCHLKSQETGEMFTGIEFIGDDDKKSQFAMYLRRHNE